MTKETPETEWMAEINGDDEEIYGDMTEEHRKLVESYKDTARVLDIFNKACVLMNEDVDVKLPLVVEVREMLEVEVGSGFRESVVSLRARVLRADDKEDVACYGSWYDSGSRFTPPDGEENFYFEGIDDDGKEVFWRHAYTISNDSGGTRDSENRMKKCQWLRHVIQQAGIRVRIATNPFGAVELQVQDTRYEDAMGAVGKKILNLRNGHMLFEVLER